LWRLDATTGKLAWRLSLGDRVTGVTPAGESLIATGESGKLYVINASTGGLKGAVEFSQPIRTAPAINDRGDRIYVVAEHSIHYTLAAKDFSCVGVYYLGHAAGAVVAPPLAVLMRAAGRDLLAPVEIVVPVPLHRRREDERGFNQAELLARRLGPPVCRAVCRCRATAPQVGLSGEARLDNLRGAFALTAAARHVRGRRVALVDDVLTTGATMAACAGALAAAGPRSIVALTAARALSERRR